MIGQSGPIGWQPKEQVANPHYRPLLQLLEFGNQFIHNLQVEGVIG
jgi:hypothetical protein